MVDPGHRAPAFSAYMGPALLQLNLPSPYSDSGESINKGDISTVVVAARACGNVKNLSLLTGYTVGGRRPAVMNTPP
jgi:hypothetical protein